MLVTAIPLMLMLGLILFIPILVCPAYEVALAGRLSRKFLHPDEAIDRQDAYLCVVVLVAMPTVALHSGIVLFATIGPWSTSLGWFTVLAGKWAWVIVVPAWWLAAAWLCYALYRPRALHGSALTLVSVTALAVICSCYAAAVVAPGPIGLGAAAITQFRRLMGLSVSGVVPGWELLAGFYMFLIPATPCVNLLLLLAHILQQRRRGGRDGRVES